MVGIPGKSKGCHTCRRRRVKCDLGQPNCERCTNIGKSCEGYQRGLVFLNRTATGLQKRQPMEEAQPRPESQFQSAVAYYGAEFASVIDSHYGSNVSSQSQSIPPQIDDSIVTLKRYESLFLEDYLPLDPRRGGNTLGIWLLESVCLDDQGRALECATEALFLSRVGRMYDDESILIQGRLRYGIALRELQRALLNERQATNEATLAACQALTLYEVLESTGSAVKGQKSHLYGIAKLLKHRQSVRSQSPLCEALMDYFRYSSMVLCIQQRSLALFGSLEAKDSIWPHANTLEQKLYDKGFVFASILEGIDKAKNSESSPVVVSSINTLLERCKKLDQEFTAWYGGLSEVAESNYAWQALLFQLQSQSQEPIVFPDLRLAHLLLCFWSLRMALTFTLALLFKMYHQLQQKGLSGTTEQDQSISETNHGPPQSMGATENSPQTRAPIDAFAKAVQLVDLILRAIPYCTSDGMGIASCIRCMFGLRGALGFLRLNPQFPEKLQKCQIIATQLTDKRKISFAADIARLSGKWGDTKETFSD